MARGRIHRKPYQAAHAIYRWLRSEWVWIFGECTITGSRDLRELDGEQLWAVGAAFARRAVIRTKEENDALKKFENRMDELVRPDSVTAAYEVAATQPFGKSAAVKEVGAVLTTSNGLVDAPAAGLRETPLG